MSRISSIHFNKIAKELQLLSHAVRLGVGTPLPERAKHKNVVFIEKADIVRPEYLRDLAAQIMNLSCDLIVALNEYEAADEKRANNA